MKQLFILLGATIILASCSEQKKTEGFQINCKVSGIDAGQAILLKQGSDRQYIGLDTAEIKEGKFVFSGNFDFPQLVMMEIEGIEEKIKFFAENSEIDISLNKDSLDDIQVTGSKAQADFEKLTESTETYEVEMQKLYPLFEEAEKNNDKEALADLSKKYDEFDSLKKIKINEFIEANPKSVIAPFAVRRYLVYYLTLEELQKYVQGFDSSLAKTEYYTFLKDRVEILKKVAVGKPAPDFTVNDSLGNPVSLSSFKGKYVMIDFWASWCSPCREENPNVVKMYNKFNEKGFDVFSVSFDSKRDSWLQAIKDDNLSWTHVSELNGWDNEAGKLYGVMSIPHTVLIDKEGIIIAKGQATRGENLEKKLTEIFN